MFRHWVLTKGQKYAKGMQYIKLGSVMRKKVLAELSNVTWKGQPLN